MKQSLILSAGLFAATCVMSLAAIGAIQPSHADEDGMRTVDSYTCRDVMRMSGDDRDIAVAFLHGYVLGSSGDTEFDPEDLFAATDMFIEFCLDNPDEASVDALRDAVEN